MTNGFYSSNDNATSIRLCVNEKCQSERPKRRKSASGKTKISFTDMAVDTCCKKVTIKHISAYLMYGTRVLRSARLTTTIKMPARPVLCPGYRFAIVYDKKTGALHVLRHQ